MMARVFDQQLRVQATGVVPQCPVGGLRRRLDVDESGVRLTDSGHPSIRVNSRRPFQKDSISRSHLVELEQSRFLNGGARTVNGR